VLVLVGVGQAKVGVAGEEEEGVEGSVSEKSESGSGKTRAPPWMVARLVRATEGSWGSELLLGEGAGGTPQGEAGGAGLAGGRRGGCRTVTLGPRMRDAGGMRFPKRSRRVTLRGGAPPAGAELARGRRRRSCQLAAQGAR